MDRFCNMIMATLMACVLAVFFAATVMSVNLVLRSFVPVGQTAYSGSGIGCSEATGYAFDSCD